MKWEGNRESDNVEDRRSGGGYSGGGGLGPLGALLSGRLGIGTIVIALLGGWALGINPRERLDDNDGHGFFGALGDAVVTGPTLTNVNDFRAIVIAAPASADRR